MSKKEIVILDGATVNPGDLDWGVLEALGTLRIYDRTPEDKIIERVGDAEMILTNKTPISRDVLEQTSLKFIGLFSTGYNVVDIVAAKENKVLVANVPAYSTSAVAQFTYGLILALCHRIEMHSSLVHQGDWISNRDFCFWKSPLVELRDKVIGIVGYGNIGRQVARLAFAFDMKVLAHTRTPLKNIEDINLSFVDMETMLENSDIVSLHCPLFRETHKIIDAKRLKLMKESAFLINTSRGALVDEDAVSTALKEQRIAGFATDVLSVEPMRADNPLYEAPNCIITPHIAWAAKETRTRLLNRVAENIHGFLSGKPQNLVSF